MTTSARTEPRVQLLGWSAIVASTMAWIAHLIFSAAWAVSGGRARYGPGPECNYGSAWPLHLATVCAAAVCLAALGAATVVYRHRGDATSGSGALEGQLRFLGLLGIATASVNLLLVVVEGSYVFFLLSCG